MSTPRPTLLMIGHMYATAFNRRKLNPLADYFEITCVTWPLGDSTLFGRPLADFEQQDHEPRYEFLRLPVLPKNAGITRYVHRGLARLLRRHRFDIIMVDSEPWSLIRWQTCLLSKLLQPQALFGEFSWENIERPGLKGKLLSLVYRAAARTHDFSISGNQACRSLLLRYGADAGTNLVAAQLGVDETEFCPAESAEKAALRVALDLPEECFLAGFCGRFTPAKGLRELIDAVSILRDKKLPQRDIHLALLGHGDMSDELTALSKKQPWLHVLTPRPHREVAAFMRCLDLFVLPSKPVHSGPGLWEEQFGHVLIEAMAAQVPTLGSSSGAIPEVLGMPEAVFKHSDTAALAQVFEHWLRHDVERDQLAAAQHRRVMEHFTHEALARTWGSFLLQQLDKHQSAR
jgi:glycosyltransferase involved in cell wall biosynthesis